MRTEPATIYVDALLGFRSGAPGVLRTALGRTGVQGEEAQLVLDLVMPIGLARDCAASLARVAAQAAGSEEPAGTATVANAALTMSNLVTTGLLAAATSNLAIELGRLVRATAGGAERLDEIEREILNEARNAVTEGVAIEDEAAAMGRVLGLLEHLFGRIRGQAPDQHEPDGGGSDE